MVTTTDHTAQFQEPPPVTEVRKSTSTSTTTKSSIDSQFQEPISPPVSTEETSTDGGALHKSTTEKLKDAVKKPFNGSSETTEERDTLGHKRITSPEMAAANEVLAAKDLKSP
ncbi:hypothetical protein BDW02DRAFT_563744 [Decorospora gaudefroyi]|uniref:Uncharacterized protein n=1 Tax=Decorospora gaudefroyi TaxID=184978 RepID=A0A6A5KU18_9PLEO|nr:hypothetical protein BDW02DRAFT_563744 [Decorospora gaudefroyi]